MSRNTLAGLLAILLAGGAYLYFRNPPQESPSVPATTDTASSTGGELISVEQAAQTTAQATAEFGGVSLKIDYATTEDQLTLGLGGRTEIPNDYGMLFVFPNDDYYGFWMNDMLVPIDIFWLDAQGHVVSLEENVSPETYPNVFYPTGPARYVLETVAGFARAHSIAIGTPFILKNSPDVTE